MNFPPKIEKGGHFSRIPHVCPLQKIYCNLRPDPRWGRKLCQRESIPNGNDSPILKNRESNAGESKLILLALVKNKKTRYI